MTNTSEKTQADSKDAILIATAEAQADIALVGRLTVLSLVFGVGHLFFAISIFPLLQKFDPSVDFVSNFLLRTVFCSLPFIGLFFFLKHNSAKIRTKVALFIWTYSALFTVAASINVWPIALRIDPHIIVYLSGVNSGYLITGIIMAALPNKALAHLIPALTLFVLSPLLSVAYFSGGKEFSLFVANDIAFSMIIATICGNFLWRLHWKYELLRAEQMIESSRFFEAPIIKAIFGGDKSLLEQTTVPCFVATLDIRSSTRLSHKYQERWQKFIESWLGQATEIIRNHDQTVVKTTGDGLLLAFGLFDEVPDLSDIRGIGQQVEEADEIRWKELTGVTLKCIDELHSKFFDINQEHFPGETLKLGTGVDRGSVTRGVRGGRQRVEFDIWGDSVNNSAKIEAYSKEISTEVDSTDSSLILLSPYACDYLDDLQGWKKVDVNPGHGLAKDSGIQWLVFKEYDPAQHVLKDLSSKVAS